MKYEHFEEQLGRDLSGPVVFFWTYACGSWHGIRMAPGDVVELSDGGPNDEGGYWRQSERFEHQGEFVSNRSHSAGRDCDGETSETTIYECRVDKLDTKATEHDDQFPRPALLPEWERISGRCYDQFAEAAGY